MSNNRWKGTEFHKSGGWNSARIAMLRSLASEGYSISQVAEKIGSGITRSAVGKFAYRMGLKFKGGVDVQAKAARKRIRATSAKAKAAGVAGRVPVDRMKCAADPATPLVALIDLGRDQCRYPHGHPKDPEFGFCGKPIRAHSSYCDEHHARTRSRVTGTL